MEFLVLFMPVFAFFDKLFYLWMFGGLIAASMAPKFANEGDRQKAYWTQLAAAVCAVIVAVLLSVNCLLALMVGQLGSALFSGLFAGMSIYFLPRVFQDLKRYS